MHAKINAVGIFIHCLKTKRHLFLMRNDAKFKGHWAIPGGKVEGDETLLAALERECTEEMGYMPELIKIVPIEKFTAPHNNFVYNTFFCLVAEEFIPTLNHEHIGYAWIDSDVIPKPLHPGCWNTLANDDVKDKIDILTNLYT